MVYRLWAKGVTLTWAPLLHGEYLGQAAMGFRAQMGTLHVAQLLSDLIILQRRRCQTLWLVSFDVEKCFPSLPWWGIFGVLEHVGGTHGWYGVSGSFTLNCATASATARWMVPCGLRPMAWPKVTRPALTC